MSTFCCGPYGSLSWDELVEQGTESWEKLREGVEKEGEGYITQAQQEVEEQVQEQGKALTEAVREEVKIASKQMAQTHAQTMSEELWDKAKTFVYLGAGLATVLTVAYVAKRR